MRSRMALAVALLLFALSASAQELPPFAQLDADDDGRISPEEARADERVAASFEQIDLNNDGRLDEAEYSQWKAMQEPG
jgi:hypothetical protein